MAEVKNPLFSLAATGSFGDLHYSHHSGKTFAYRSNPKEAMAPTPAQEAVRKDYTDGVKRWNAFTPAERYFWTQLAPHMWQPRQDDSTPARLTGYQTYIKFWRSIEAEPGKLLIFMAAWIAIAIQYSIPLPF